jgi:8-oxo-dGTP diphosphatase
VAELGVAEADMVAEDMVAEDMVAEDMVEGVAEHTHRVVAGILVREGHVLLCHRTPDRRWYPDAWDFPGGHIEDDETPEQALVRELREELGVTVPLPTGVELARWQTSEFDCSFWIVEQWAGTPANVSVEEHDDLAWWPASAIAGLRLVHPDYPALIEQALT